MPKEKSMLVFSIALNGYQWLYKDCLQSHARYARSIDADYVTVQRPWFTRLGTECCWLKLLLLKQALQKDYQQVLFLDADAQVKDTAPDIREVLQQDKHIYMALGKTLRFNSGVILVQQSAQALKFIEQVLNTRHTPIASKHDVGWGENGHIIAAAERNPWVAKLELEWNNTWRPELDDHIRHFNHGIMRNQINGYKLFNLAHKCLAKTTRGINQLQKLRDNLLTPYNKPETQLEKLFHLTQRHHPQFF